MANLKYEIRSNDARDASVARVDLKLEVVVIPVSEVDRAKEFYGSLGRFHPATNGRVSGPALDRSSYRSFASFRDPDGNGWLLQKRDRW